MDYEEIPKCFYEMDVIPSEYFNRNYKTEDITKFINGCPKKFIQIMKDINNQINDKEYKYYFVKDSYNGEFYIRTNNYKNIVFDVFYLRYKLYNNHLLYNRIKNNIYNFESIINLNNFTAITYYIVFKYLHIEKPTIVSIKEIDIIDTIKPEIKEKNTSQDWENI